MRVWLVIFLILFIVFSASLSSLMLGEDIDDIDCELEPEQCLFVIDPANY